VAECLEAVDECGAPVVVIAGGEPLLHKELDQVVEGIIARKKFVIVCSNALLLEKKLHLFKPNKYFTWSVHLDGDREDHDRSVCQDGVYDRAVAAIAKVKAAGFRCVINTTLFSNAEPERVARFFDDAMAMGIDGISLSPGYAYERAPDQQHFLNRRKTKELFRDIFARAIPGKMKWSFNQSALFLDFLAGNRTYACTPWGNPCRTYFGWQRPCYLLGEGYTKTFKELMETTEWDQYGVGKYEKCADCMVHCGFEGTATTDAVKNPLKLLKLAISGIKTEGQMAPEISLANQRPANFVFSGHVEKKLAEIRASNPRAAKKVVAAE
jgi:hopanoid biosynthesis associated radical SAM protein HpnH